SPRLWRQPRSTLFPYTTLFRSYCAVNAAKSIVLIGMMGAGKSSVGRCLQQRTGLTRLDIDEMVAAQFGIPIAKIFEKHGEERFQDRKSTRLNSSHRTISYAVFC